jgi:hypothetical protein
MAPTRTSGEVRFPAVVKGIADIIYTGVLRNDRDCDRGHHAAGTGMSTVPSLAQLREETAAEIERLIDLLDRLELDLANQ